MERFQLSLLPDDLQIEIFSFLSIKHLPKLIVISKSVHQQLNQSDLFWTQLLCNYAKRACDEEQYKDYVERIKLLSKDKVSSNSSKIKLLKELVKMKQLRFETLREVNKESQYKLMYSASQERRIVMELAHMQRFLTNRGVEDLEMKSSIENLEYARKAIDEKNQAELNQFLELCKTMDNLEFD